MHNRHYDNACTRYCRTTATANDLRAAMSGDAYRDHFEQPRNRGAMAGPDGVGAAGHRGHESITVYLRVRNDTIEQATFECEGCEAAAACGSAVTSLAAGRHLDDASEIDQDAVATALAGIPADKRHVAGLAAEALAAATIDYIAKSIQRQHPTQ